MKKRILSIVLLLCVLILLIVVVISVSEREKENGILVRHTVHSGRYSDWVFRFSEEEILEVADDYDKIGFMMPDHYYEVFKPVGSGEVTIYWDRCEAGEILYTYNITFYVDEEGNITQISSENEPPRQNNFVAAIQEYMVSYENAIYEIILFLFGLFLDVFGLHL